MVLIKFVLQDMPLYLFLVLVAPKWVLESIRALQNTFLWKGDKKSYHWGLIKWDTSCCTKKDGGIELRDPMQSNEILSAKIWWNWITKNQSQWEQL